MTQSGRIVGVEPPRRLVQTGHSLDHLSGPGPWVDTKHFRPVPDGPITVAEALRVLLDEPEYRDHYCSPENEGAGGALHGPYWADRIQTSDFTEISTEESEAILSAWRNEWRPIDESPHDIAVADSVVEAALTLIRRADQRLYLRDLREEAEHDWGWVLGFGGFHEFVLIDADGGISLVVASDD